MAKEGRDKRFWWLKEDRKDIDKEKKNQKIWKQDPTIQIKPDIIKADSINSMTKIVQLVATETKQFWGKIWQQRLHNRKFEWLISMKNELQGTEEEPEAEIHLESLSGSLKKIENWKVLGHDGIHGFWFKWFMPIHEKLMQQQHKCLKEANIPEWMMKGKTTLIQKDKKRKRKRKHSKCLQIDNVSINDVENPHK